MNAQEITLRSARREDVAAVARIHRLAFFGAMPHMPVLHTPEEDLAYFSEKVLPTSDVWVATFAEAPDVITAFIAFDKEWVHHLYVHPHEQQAGMGSALLRLAQASADDALQLWAFQCNRDARRFYEKRGFRVVRETDGADNEEKQPDVLYRWTRDARERQEQAVSRCG